MSIKKIKLLQYEANELESNNNNNKKKKKKKTKKHYEAAHIESGTTKLVSINALLEEGGWETLSSRRNRHKLT